MDGVSKTAVRIAGAYFLASVLWIVISDRALEAWVAPERLGLAQTLKGLAFMAVVSVALFVGVRRALTAREESANSLRATSANLRILLEQALTGVFVIRDRRFVYVNQRMAEIFGYTTDELTGQPVERVIHEGDRLRVVERLGRSSERRQSKLFGFRGLRANDTVVHVESQSTRTEIDGEPAILGILLDVTQRKVAETQYQAARRLEALGRMAGGVAHDFNNLLTAISGAADLMRKHQGLPAECIDDLHFILQTTERGARLSHQLLAFSRNRPQHVGPLDVNQTIAAMQPLLRRLVDASIQIHIDLDETARPIVGDEHQMEQVVLNLVLNARDAMPHGGDLSIATHAVRVEDAPPEAQAISRDDGHLVRVTIEDTGRGIPADVQPRIFEPFFTTKGEKGTGLGLATVHGIVAQTGGYILLQSKPGRTCFSIYFPTTDRVTKDAPAGPTHDGQSANPNCRVLLVEDEAVVRAVTRRALEQAGYQVIEAENGQSARSHLDSGSHIDVVLMDLSLPDESGVDVARSLNGRASSPPVVFMSGYGMDDIAIPDDVDAAGFLEKPFTIEAVRDAVTRARR